MIKNYFSSSIKEPYRILFPLGILTSFFGLGIWILFWLHPLIGYPINQHKDIQGKPLILCFVLGFLYTLLPKLLRIPHINKFGFLFLIFSLIGQLTFSLFQIPWAIDLLYMLLIGQFLLFIILGYKNFKNTFPIHFIYLIFAFASNFVTCLIILSSYIFSFESSKWLNISRLFQHQGFMILIIFGVGSFLLPKLMMTPEDVQKTLRSKIPSPITISLVSVLFIISYPVEGFFTNHNLGVQVSACIRLILMMVILLSNCKIYKLPRKQPQYLKWAWFSLWSLPISQLGILLQPMQRVSWEHVMYINGFLLLILTIASKVLSGHANDTGLLKRHPKLMFISGSVITIGMILRLLALYRASYFLYLGIGAACVLIGITIWTIVFLPKAIKVPGHMQN